LDDLAVIEKEAPLCHVAPIPARRIAWVWAGAMITEDQSQYEPFWALSAASRR